LTPQNRAAGGYAAALADSIGYYGFLVGRETAGASATPAAAATLTDVETPASVFVR
jgi:hypothetical protein